MEQLKEEKVFSGGFDTLLIVDDDEINRGILDNLFSAFFPWRKPRTDRRGWKRFWKGRESTARCSWMW